MNRTLGIAMLVVGIVLLIFGLSASDSIGSSFSKLFTGAPTDKAIWLIVGGLFGVAMGLFSLLRTKNA